MGIHPGQFSDRRSDRRRRHRAADEPSRAGGIPRHRWPERLKHSDKPGRPSRGAPCRTHAGTEHTCRVHAAAPNPRRCSPAGNRRRPGGTPAAGRRGAPQPTPTPPTRTSSTRGLWSSPPSPANPAFGRKILRVSEETGHVSMIFRHNGVAGPHHHLGAADFMVLSGRIGYRAGPPEGYGRGVWFYEPAGARHDATRRLGDEESDLYSQHLRPHPIRRRARHPDQRRDVVDAVQGRRRGRRAPAGRQYLRRRYVSPGLVSAGQQRRILDPADPA